MVSLVLSDRIAEHLSTAVGQVLVGPAGEASTGPALLAQVERRRLELVGLGVRPGDRVLVRVTATPSTVVSLLATMAAAAIAVPVVASAPSAHLERIATDASPVVTCAEDTLTALPRGRTVEVVDGSCLLVYTSGTTGAPKGIVHSQETLLAAVDQVATAWGMGPSDRLLHVLPLHHVHGLVVGLLTTLAAGASVELCARFDVDTVVSRLAETTLFFGVPTMYHRLARAGQLEALASLRLVVSGSAPLDLALATTLRDAGVPILERYGMTETCLTLTQPLDGPRVPGTVGEPFGGVEARVVDGALEVRTPALALGVFGLDAPLTADPEGWFATGDLVEYGRGGYRIVGRRSNLIITGGSNVVPEAVEAILLAHPTVLEAVVRGEPDEDLGQRVVASVVLAVGGDVDHLDAYLAAQLPAPERPRRIDVVHALARNDMGKIVRG